jgi:hypothetical protein
MRAGCEEPLLGKLVKMEKNCVAFRSLRREREEERERKLSGPVIHGLTDHAPIGVCWMLDLTGKQNLCLRLHLGP